MEGDRQASAQSQDFDRQLPLGDLILPPRVTLQNPASNLFYPTEVSPLSEESHPLSSKILAQMSQLAHHSLGSSGSKRNRIGSWGLIASGESKRPSFRNGLELLIAVIGSPGCGKSTVIHQDASTYGYSTTEICSLPFGILYRYDRRLEWLRQSESSLNIHLLIYEMDITTLVSVPQVDGIFVCYDASDNSSFEPVARFLRMSHPFRLPTVGLACKSDLNTTVDPQIASELFQGFDLGLVEVSIVQDDGKTKMGKSFNWILRSILLTRSLRLPTSQPDQRNPASPESLVSPLLLDHPKMVTALEIPVYSLHSSTSPTRTPLTADLNRNTSTIHLDPPEKKQSNQWNLTDYDHVNYKSPPPSLGAQVDKKEKLSRPVQYATLEELLDKLLFLAVSGDDPTYISNFLLTYRRFATPRSVLLAMQKRMRHLDTSPGDPMLACYAQMRICHLLESWMETYAHDFAVPGASGALNALVKSIIAKTYLLHYGSDFLPFLEQASSLVDKDAAWAQKCEVLAEENDDPYSPFGDEDEFLNSHVRSPITSSPSLVPLYDDSILPFYAVRERKLSLPLSSLVPSIPSPTNHPDSQEMSTKQLLKELLKISSDIQNLDSGDIAQEITRVEVVAFMSIEPRDWLHYTLVTGKKSSDSDTISRFNAISSHLADWVVSLILCHDKPRHRARQIEKFVDIAHKLRALNNYSALRAFVAGINNSTFQGDDTMEVFRTKAPEHFKNLLSWDVLLQHRGAHQAYRMALRNTKGACIPALEVHMSDLIRAQEGNPDYHPSDHGQIHWGKFNMFGKFIQSTAQCQVQCDTSRDYDFPERPRIGTLIFNEFLMPEDVQMTRMAPLPNSDTEELHRFNTARSSSRDHSTSAQRDAAFIRRIFQW
ncbi:hypothetical protein SERLA73DRAFT_165636 [Serpula lacrymans var. lacrymans S7.3]|uniref:Ras GEF n=2 Tax=Serpula lacrymans var. lacrymans TaxID=341189 RepID=F8PLI3_SERL3|nr:uncharacterized protein SERLADRAFT_445807 [Serpula lacrymans var. lacrymans S7.9]EGO02465.1 hypothetical protein SERLA73DRAFT_165636 [Serpula lacrymans var. lacrymans S7.3]EGO28190.1 hypothetical protein SERLADRAFT_445807 [Serpula lacrymans var. lacrymans S7.9]